MSSELEELESQLRDAKAEEKENERDQRRLETINELIRRFDGVYGRMTELLKVPCHLCLDIVVAIWVTRKSHTWKLTFF